MESNSKHQRCARLFREPWDAIAPLPRVGPLMFPAYLVLPARGICLPVLSRGGVTASNTGILVLAPLSG